jgi:hypothetical protein
MRCSQMCMLLDFCVANYAWASSGGRDLMRSARGKQAGSGVFVLPEAA